MRDPFISVLLCTVRGDHAFREHPDWILFDHVKEQLEMQTYRNFELVVVDGLRAFREFPRASFEVKHVAPMVNLWTLNKKVAISTYRNTGIVIAAGDLIVNVDDTFTIPRIWLEAYAALYKQGQCGVATWRDNDDKRLKPNEATRLAFRGEVYGYGSYPRKAALQLNGYNLAFDGSMYLEDVEFGVRLNDIGVKQQLFWLDGFKLEAQTGHDARAVDLNEPIVKCCNPAWQLSQVKYPSDSLIANRRDFWTKERIQELLAPCQWLADTKCLHHHGANECAYLKSSMWRYANGAMRSFALETHPLARQLFVELPVIDLAELCL